MKRKSLSCLKWLFIAVVSVGLCNCGKDKQTGFQMADLHGLWLEEGTQHYMRFLEEKADTSNFEWGKQWDEADKVTEDRLEYHKNGWFMYELDGSRFTLIHMMRNGGVEIPKVYTVKTLNASRLEFVEEDDRNNVKYKFDKVE